mgnify:CR=1 FL=1
MLVKAAKEVVFVRVAGMSDGQINVTGSQPDLAEAINLLQAGIKLLVESIAKEREPKVLVGALMPRVPSLNGG